MQVEIARQIRIVVSSQLNRLEAINNISIQNNKKSKLKSNIFTYILE